MLTKPLQLLKSYTSLNGINSANGTVRVCGIYILPSDCFESNNPFLNELKERRINHHFPKHTSCLSAEPVCSTTVFLPYSSWDTEPLCRVALLSLSFKSEVKIVQAPVSHVKW